jgi:hypothetical protein
MAATASGARPAVDARTPRNPATARGGFRLVLEGGHSQRISIRLWRSLGSLATSGELRGGVRMAYLSRVGENVIVLRSFL